MLFSIVIAYLPYALITAYTPGPNNIVALYAVSQNGWQKGKNILCGIGIGFFSVMVICALFCYELAKYIPAATEVLRYVGATYIAYLAVYVALSKPGGEESPHRSFMSGFLLQFVNIKIILYAITIYTGYVLPVEQGLNVLLAHSVMLTLIGLTGTFTWAAAGSVLQRVLTKHYRPFNIIMALVLLWCAASLVFDL